MIGCTVAFASSRKESSQLRTLIAFTVVLGVSGACFAQEPTKKINKVPIEYTNPGSGPEMFKS